MALKEVAAIVLCAVLILVLVLMLTADDDTEVGNALVEPAAIPYEGELVETDGPIGYFVDRCARCHGVVDHAYSGIKHPKRGDDLRRTISEMAEQRAMAPLDEAGVQQQYDLHLAIVDREPYVWIDETRTDVIAGETIPGTKIVLKTPDATYAAKFDDAWFTLPRKQGTLIATRDKHQLKIAIPENGLNAK